MAEAPPSDAGRRQNRGENGDNEPSQSFRSVQMCGAQAVICHNGNVVECVVQTANRPFLHRKGQVGEAPEPEEWGAAYTQAEMAGIVQVHSSSILQCLSFGAGGGIGLSFLPSTTEQAR